MPLELLAETVEQAPKAKAKRRARSEPLAFAYFGLVLFMVVYFARPEDWIPGLAVVPLAKISGVLIVVALAFSYQSIRWHMPWEITLLALLVVQLWLAAIFSPVWRGGAVNVMMEFSKVLPVVVVIFGAVRSIDRLRLILFVQGASVATIAIASILHGRISAGRLQGALSGMYGNPNDLATVIDITLPICLALALITRSRLEKLAWVAAIMGMIYAVVLTASRGGAIALGVGTLVCLWQLGVKGRRYYLLFLVPVAVVAFLFFSGKVLHQRFDQTSVDGTPSSRDTEATESAQQRKELLIQSLRITAQHPLFGVGPGNFEIVSGVWRVAHNSFTQMSAEGGVVAFILYLVMVGKAVTSLGRLSRYTKAAKDTVAISMALKASLATYLVASLFASDAYQMFAYCLIGYICALQVIARRAQTAARENSASPAFAEFTEPAEVGVWQ